MESYKCIICDYIYNPKFGDPDYGINSGTSFQNLPDNWLCPQCGASKEQFEQI
ncbi:MAG: rubredoxin [Candidatus Brocadia sp. WS118]|nr:MAG: rubredoxin [Candidatus Brocadia sp. WS118]